MSLYDDYAQLFKTLCIEDQKINFLFANFANIDVVGHIENERNKIFSIPC